MFSVDPGKPFWIESGMIPSAGKGIIPSSTLWNEFRKMLQSVRRRLFGYPLAFGRRHSVAGASVIFLSGPGCYFQYLHRGSHPMPAWLEVSSRFQSVRQLSAGSQRLHTRLRTSPPACIEMHLRVGNFELTGLLLRADCFRKKQSICLFRLPSFRRELSITVLPFARPFIRRDSPLLTSVTSGGFDLYPST